jgi:hypothetical protein
MGQEDAKALLQAATEAAKEPDGASLTIIIGESKFGKGVYTSVALEASTPTGRYQATATQSTAPRPAIGAAPAKFAFKPKIATKV